MSYILDDGGWVKKANYNPKVKLATVVNSRGINSNCAQSSILNSILTEAQDIKQSLGVVVSDQHKSKVLQSGVEASRPAAARAEIYDDELTVAVQNSYSSLSTHFEKILPFLLRAYHR
ncbi:hypothetical protein HAX54_001947 [Datura stramonium]|uniref:Uncharacterized protein n=1 Tax=Datura stramonium TaxID=4076 RepID=A0ABS8T585_DATST|nr:hypothetical protein [Datura stramonium]